MGNIRVVPLLHSVNDIIIQLYLRCSLNRNGIQRQIPYQVNRLATKWYQSKTVRMYAAHLYTECTALYFDSSRTY